MEAGTDVPRNDVTSAKKKRTRRIKVVPDKCPNPLFEKWLTEWRDDAAKKQLKTKYVYDKALRSLRKYPLKMSSGREAIILDSFGQKICDMLDRKLASHVTTSSMTDDEPPPPPPTVVAPPVSTSKRPRVGTAKTYVPVPRTGPHALLMTLHSNCNNDADGQVFMSKSALIAAAQPFCDKSFTVPDHGSYYTAWSSMGTLVNKGLVRKHGNPAKYCLTYEGQDLVVRLQGVNCDSEPPPPPPCVRQPRSRIIDLEDDEDVGIGSDGTSTASSTEEYSLRPGEFDVILCVNNCETVTGAYNERKLMIQSELRKNGVGFDVRKLHVGDFLWIAREKVSVVPGQLQPPKARELVLDYVIERKRKDDLAASIIDGRFHEQKHRLKNCELKHRIYLVEEYGSSKDRLSLPDSSLQQAIANTQVTDGFIVKHTKDVVETVAYLTLMTRYLQSVHSSGTLYSRSFSTRTDDRFRLITFDEFNRSSMKVRPTSVTEMFVRQLVQASGMSVERSRAVARRCPTPATLFDRYARCATQAEREALFTSVGYGLTGRNLGMVISRLLCQLYTSPELR